MWREYPIQQDFQVENEPHAALITVNKTTLRETSLQPLEGNFPLTLAVNFPYGEG